MDTTTNLGLGGVQNPFLTGSGNPYLQANIDAASADLVKNYNLSAAPAQNAAAVRSGSFGNSALGEMAQQDQNILQKNLGNLSNSARMQDYQNQQGLYMGQQASNIAQNEWNLGFGRDLYNDAYGQNQQNLQTGIGLLGTLGQYNQGDLTTATNVQNTPLNYWSAFTNGANALGGQGGQATTTQGTTSNPLLSGLGGAQLGSNLWSQWNNSGSSTPQQTSSQIGAFNNLGSSNNGWWGTSAGGTQGTDFSAGNY
jgi:hypothetical protein